jgi:thiamine-monophosphate kinase
VPDELEIIETIMRAARRLPRGYSEIGDDVALIPGQRRKLVMKVDMLVQSTDVPPGMSFRQAARKAVAMCVSDFAAKGVKPDSYMVSIGVSRKTSSERIKGLALGLKDASEEWDVKLVGGDTNESSELVIDCAMVGFDKRVVGRAGARPGDVVITTGCFGHPPAGLEILMKGARSGKKFREAAVKSVLLPTPNLQLGLALRRFLTSSMDSSDGLARSLHTLAKSSGVGIEVHTLPMAEGVDEFAGKNGLSARRLVLAGGEEYFVVGTMKNNNLEAARRTAKKCGGSVLEIGRVTGRKGEVTLRLGNKSEQIEDAGWVHLR